MITGGISTNNGKIEAKAILIDCNTERVIDAPDMLEPKVKH